MCDATRWSQFGKMRAPSTEFALKMYAQFLPPWPLKCPWIYLSKTHLLRLNALKKWTKKRLCAAWLINQPRTCPFPSLARLKWSLHVTLSESIFAFCLRSNVRTTTELKKQCSEMHSLQIIRFIRGLHPAVQEHNRLSFTSLDTPVQLLVKANI